MKLNCANRLQYLEQYLTAQRMTDVAYPVFYKKTPIRTGNARRHTTRSKEQIDAAYPYAKRLDEGYSSQSREGMVQPAVDAVRAYVRKIIGG